jgi:quinolinate synthase
LTTIRITRASDVLPEEEVAALQPTIDEINRLKQERNAVVAAHNYMTPDIYHLAADITGDSLALAYLGLETEADVIVLAGVHFMAETVKLIAPDKTVLIPDLRAGCSLADGITGADVRRLKEQYPGVPVVTYVNTSAEVKAESDITCTSSNAVAVVESLGVDRVIFTPDQYLGSWVATQTDVDVILWEGSCMVHERFTGQEIADYKHEMGDIPVIAHPESPPDVLALADYVGSTHGMIYLGHRSPAEGSHDDHGVLHGRQRSCGHPQYHLRPSLQLLSPHEADNSRQHRALAADHDPPGGDPRGRRRASPPRRVEDARGRSPGLTKP